MTSTLLTDLTAQHANGQLPSVEQALALADVDDTRSLADIACELRDQGFNNVVTYSRKVFIPLTHLCRDVCHYCTFAQVPRKVQAPYMSVVSPSTHDMPSLRAWWKEDLQITAGFAWSMFGDSFPASELSGTMAERILRQHLESPAMWAVFPLQDLLAIDENLRHPNPETERINVPAIMPYYWRYRMHLGLDELATADAFNRRVAGLLHATGRASDR